MIKRINKHFRVSCSKHHNSPVLIDDSNRDEILEERFLNFRIDSYKEKEDDYSPSALYITADILKQDDTVHEGCGLSLVFDYNIEDYTESQFVTLSTMQCFPLIENSLWFTVLGAEQYIYERIIEIYRTAFSVIYYEMKNFCGG
jgi:hypothetical protein